MPPPKLLIPIADYQRITRVIATVANSVGKDTAGACTYFSVMGAAILERVYKKRAVPVAGAAVLHVGDPDGRMMMYGRINDGQLISDGKGFHCWIHCDDYVIDFMAPLYRDAWQRGGFESDCPRKLFQKPITAMAPSPFALRNPGDFFLEPDIDLTGDLLIPFATKAGIQDLANACVQWYTRPPKPISPTLGLLNDLGQFVQMKLNPIEVAGVW